MGKETINLLRIMKRTLSLMLLCLTLAFSSCESSLAVLQGLTDGLNQYNSSVSGYYPTTQNYQPTSVVTSTEKEWHNCSSCSGSGRCKYCSGSGKNEYAKNGRCGVCKGTGKCAGCNGKGGWKI